MKHILYQFENPDIKKKKKKKKKEIIIKKKKKIIILYTETQRQRTHLGTILHSVSCNLFLL